MSQTPKFAITEMDAAQSQPEIVVNEALRILETMSQLLVIDKDVNAPPASPDDGDTYLIPSGSSGEWASYPFHIAVAVGGSWVYIEPRIGYLAYVEDEDLYYQYGLGSPSGWVAMDFGGSGGGGSGISGITVRDVGSPSVTFNLITTLELLGNVSVTQPSSGTVRIDVGNTAGSGGGGINGIDVIGVGSPGATVQAATQIRFDGLCEVTDGGGGVATVTILGDGGGSGVGSATYAPTITDSTTARVLALTDAGAYIRMTNGSANTVTVPPEASVAWSSDTEISIRQAGAGSTSIVAGAGVTINASSLVLLGQHATVTLKKVGVNIWDLMGATA